MMLLPELKVDWLHLSRRFFGVLLCVLVGGVGIVVAEEDEAEPALVVAPVIKADRDKRQYRHLTLANQLKVLLISDPDVSSPSLALDVASGYHQDPPQASGTAALLAYSLLQAQIAESSSVLHSATKVHTHVGADHTQFVVLSDASAAHLFSLLDTVSQAIKSPQLSESVFTRALTYTDAVFQGKLAQAVHRRQDVYCTLFNPEHPEARHCRASIRIEQQGAEEIQAHLTHYHQRFYSADAMTLVVSSSLPLDDLEAEVVARFAALPVRHSIAQIPIPLMEEGRLPQSVVIRGNDDAAYLTMSFPVPYVPEHKPHHPYSIASALLENQGQGSLLVLLQELGWAEDVATELRVISRHEALFEIQMQLTGLGVRAQDQVVALVFYVLGQIRSRGLNEWRYDELAQLADLVFRFDERPSANTSIGRIARRMHSIHPEDTLHAPYRFEAFNERLQSRYLSYLNSGNVIVGLSAPGIEADQLSPMLATPYRLKSVKAEQPDIKIAIRRKLSFPEQNTFIPKRLNVKEAQILPTPTAVQGTIDEPVKIVDKPQFRAWYLQDVAFRVPKAAIFIKVDTQMAEASLSGAASTHLFAHLLREQLRLTLYQARAAGFDVAVDAEPTGLSIALTGYSSQQGLMLTRLGQLMADARFEEEHFEQARRRLRAQLESAELTPEQLIEQWHLEPSWAAADLAQALQQLEYEPFRQFARRFFEGAYLKAFYYGNLYRQEAQRLAALTEHYLGKSASRPEPLQQLRVFALDASSVDMNARRDRLALPWGEYLPASAGLPAAHVYLQAVDARPESHTQVAVLLELLQDQWARQPTTGDESAVFEAKPLNLSGYPGARVSLSAARSTSGQLMAALQTLLAQDVTESAASLNSAVDRVRQHWQSPSPTLVAEGRVLWRMIEVHGADFDFNQRRLAALDALTQEQLAEAYVRIFQLPERQFWLLGADATEALIRRPQPQRYSQQLERYRMP